MKRQTYGRYSFSAREREQSESPADAVELLRRMADQVPPARGLDGLEQACRACIIAHGLPADDRRFAARRHEQTDAGLEWTEYKDTPSGWTAYRGVRALASGAVPLIKIDSVLGYACRTLDAVLLAREAAARGNTQEALERAAEAGALASESDMLRHYLAEKAGGDRANRPHRDARQRCQDEARRQWDSDPDRTMRIGAMAEHCRLVLQREGFQPVPALNTIRDYLRPIAPAYARKGGRSRKR